jgi:hypothetical protein
MSDRDDFLTWVTTVLYQAELALHNGRRRTAPGDLVAQ